MNVFLNYDTGCFSAALIQMQGYLKISVEQISYLNSLVYIGLCVASLLGSYLFHKVSANFLISSMVIVNAIACYGFVSTTNIWILYSIRFVLGFT